MRKFLTLFLPLFFAFGVLSSPAVLAEKNSLKMVVIDNVSAAKLRELNAMGLDIAAARKIPGSGKTADLGMPNYRVELVISKRDESKLQKRGIKWRAITTQKSTSLSNTEKKATTEESVYQSFDEAGGIHDQLREISALYPQLSQLERIGQSRQHRPILAMRLNNRQASSDDKKAKKHRKPQVLYMATTHAREWVSTEMAMRLIRYLLENHGIDTRITTLLDTTDIWIIPVVNPDGYEYTFTDERLWRKNLRDNDGDGEITGIDGVDLNRNFPAHWGLDDEGSSPDFADFTYRGDRPGSEPETRALMRFIRNNDFKFSISYHTYSDLILYPLGHQVKTPSFDDPIFVAQAGTDDNPAIKDSILDRGYDPGVGADLYITNGDYTDWAYGRARVPSYTVELTAGEDADGNVYGFEFPDDEGMVQQVFEDNLEFALSLAESAHDPAHPVSPVGIETKDIYHTPITQSYGARQLIEVIARVDHHPVLVSSVNGRFKYLPMTKRSGKIYNRRPGVHYARFTAKIARQTTGAAVKYGVFSEGDWLGPYEYTVNSANGHSILILAAEDYSGENPEYDDPSQLNYLKYYTDALDAAGYGYDIWDVDSQGIPNHIEVLSHYKTVLWYSGDDFAPTVPLELETQEAEVLHIRDFINYSKGTLFASGQDISYLPSTAAYYSDDFFQYYLGAKTHVEGAGVDAEGAPFSIAGKASDPVLGGFSFDLQGGTGANNQTGPDTFLPLMGNKYYGAAEVMASYDRPGGPFDPNSGDNYVYSQRANMSFMRLGGTFTLPAGSPTLSFWMSNNIEANWDFVAVEVCIGGTDNCTTLPDSNGSTTQVTGDSCTAGWVDSLHPFLAHYMDADCNPTGTTGEWHAITDNSGGWHEVSVDLTAYAGQEVELYISNITDWGTQGLGVFIDDISLSGNPAQDFETDTGDWTTSVAPDSSAVKNWERIEGTGFVEGPAIRTKDTVFLGFGFEAIDTDENRMQIMDKVIQYLTP